MSKKDRLKRLEASHKQPEKYLAVFESDGKRWITNEVDYRQALSGDEDRYITDEEYERLAEQYTIIHVVYVQMEPFDKRLR